MNSISNQVIVLKTLTVLDADDFYNIYSSAEVIKNFENSPFIDGENSVDFTKRIIQSCNYIWTIRLKDTPDKIIGDCAFHDWDKDKKEIEIGGSLLPDYWGKSIMKQAFELIIDFSLNTLGINTIIGKTNIDNFQAIKMIEKLGFQKSEVNGNEVIMKKNIN